MSDLISTLSDLVRINSINAFYKDGPGEAEVARYIERFFARHKIETWRQPVIEANDSIEARYNVIARLPGLDSTRRILLEAHMDTVSVDGMSISPFEPHIRDGLLYGRGACDTKAGLAGMMHAIAEIKMAQILPPCDVLLAAVVDEEFSFQGVSALCKATEANGAIVAEPTELRVAIASKGVLRWRMIASGKSAHSSKVHLGKNAIYHMARIALAIEQDNASLSSFIHPLLGPATCNLGKISGGVQVNFVPDRCVIEIDRRLLPNESVPEVLEHYSSLIEKLRVETTEMDVHMEAPMLVDEAWSVDPASSIVQTAMKALEELACYSQPIGVPFGSDASKLGRAGIPTIIFGPGSIDQAHAAIEFVDLKQVERACDFYRRCILGFSMKANC